MGYLDSMIRDAGIRKKVNLTSTTATKNSRDGTSVDSKTNGLVGNENANSNLNMETHASSHGEENIFQSDQNSSLDSVTPSVSKSQLDTLSEAFNINADSDNNDSSKSNNFTEKQKVNDALTLEVNHTSHLNELESASSSLVDKDFQAEGLRPGDGLDEQSFNQAHAVENDITSAFSEMDNQFDKRPSASSDGVSEGELNVNASTTALDISADNKKFDELLEENLNTNNQRSNKLDKVINDTANTSESALDSLTRDSELQNSQLHVDKRASFEMDDYTQSSRDNEKVKLSSLSVKEPAVREDVLTRNDERQNRQDAKLERLESSLAKLSESKLQVNVPLKTDYSEGESESLIKDTRNISLEKARVDESRSPHINNDDFTNVNQPQTSGYMNKAALNAVIEEKLAKSFVTADESRVFNRSNDLINKKKEDTQSSSNNLNTGHTELAHQSELANQVEELSKLKVLRSEVERVQKNIGQSVSQLDKRKATLANQNLEGAINRQALASARQPARPKSVEQPKVNVGQIDVYVQSNSSVAKKTSDRSSASSSLANPHYLGSL